MDGWMDEWMDGAFWMHRVVSPRLPNFKPPLRRSIEIPSDDESNHCTFLLREFTKNHSGDESESLPMVVTKE
jgi:hypothetical protein